MRNRLSGGVIGFGGGAMQDRLTEAVIGCVIRVHKVLGAGFLESIYRRALVIELRRAGLKVEVERPILVRYRGYVVGRHRLDLLVEGSLILELKAVEQ